MTSYLSDVGWEVGSQTKESVRCSKSVISFSLSEFTDTLYVQTGRPGFVFRTSSTQLNCIGLDLGLIYTFLSDFSKSIVFTISVYEREKSQKNHRNKNDKSFYLFMKETPPISSTERDPEPRIFSCAISNKLRRDEVSKN